MEKEKVEISDIASLLLSLRQLQSLTLSLRIPLTGKPESCLVTGKTMQVVYPEQGFPEIVIITNLEKGWKCCSCKRNLEQETWMWAQGARRVGTSGMQVASIWCLSPVDRSTGRPHSCAWCFLPSRSDLGVAMCTCVRAGNLSTCSALLLSSSTVPFASNIYYISSVLTSLSISFFVLSLRGAVNGIICQSVCKRAESV